MALYFSLKKWTANVHNSGNENFFSREATTLGKMPMIQISNPRAGMGFHNLIQTIRLTPPMILQAQQACSFEPPALCIECFPFSPNGTVFTSSVKLSFLPWLCPRIPMAFDKEESISHEARTL